MTNIEFFENCIKQRDFFALVYFISDKCKTEKELLDVCRKSHNITLDMIGELVESATHYIDYNSRVMASAKKIRDSEFISKESKEKLDLYIAKEISSTTIMGYKLQYFIQLIEKELRNQEN